MVLTRSKYQETFLYFTHFLSFYRFLKRQEFPNHARVTLHLPKKPGSCKDNTEAKAIDPVQHLYSYRWKQYIYIYAVNKKGVSQKTRRLMGENSVSFQMFLIRYCLLLHLVQKAKFLCSSNVRAILRCLSFFCVGVACAEAKIWKKKQWKKPSWDTSLGAISRVFH